MVELKRWIAKDATNHGQLIADSDLSDEAIFDRLENDIPFRSVATALVQKFGYLKPTVNPESPQGQEQQILIRERARWIAQDEQADRARARQQQDIQRSQYCDPSGTNCPAGSTTSPGIEQVPQRPGTNPSQPVEPENAPITPPMAGGHLHTTLAKVAEVRSSRGGCVYRSPNRGKHLQWILLLQPHVALRLHKFREFNGKLGRTARSGGAGLDLLLVDPKGQTAI